MVVATLPDLTAEALALLCTHDPKTRAKINEGISRYFGALDARAIAVRPSGRRRS
jgi:hypothetical protein